MPPAHCFAHPTRWLTARLAIFTFIRPEFFIKKSRPQLLANRSTRKKSKLQYRTKSVYAVNIINVLRLCLTKAVSRTTTMGGHKKGFHHQFHCSSSFLTPYSLVQKSGHKDNLLARLILLPALGSGSGKVNMAMNWNGMSRMGLGLSLFLTEER